MARLDLAHRPGNHCGSTSLRNLSEYYGWGYDEAACFGLATGVGFTFLRLPDSPERMFFGRPPWLERAFFEILDVPHSIYEGQSFEAAWTDITAEVDDGNPVMIFTDLYYLDYYDSSTHFAPHSLLVVGYDDESVHLADSEFEAIQELPLDRLREAMTSDHVIPLQCRYLTIEDPIPGVDFAAGAADAIRETTTYMLNPDGTTRETLGFGDHGVAGIRALAADLPSWHELEDPSWTTRFAYQNVESRGTGGGAFRKMYASFLERAAETVSIPADAPREMHDIAAAWTDLGAVLYEASETDDSDEFVSLLADASDRAGDIADRETAVYEALDSSL